MLESKLFFVTAFISITTMSTTFWMAFYLFARGFPNKITLRAVVVLFAISVYFFGAYSNIFHLTIRAAWRAVLLIIGMAFWYSVTYNLMSEHSQQRLRKLAYGMYAFALLTGILILAPGSFINEEGNAFYVNQMSGNIPDRIYLVFQFSFLASILFNLLTDHGVGFTPEGKYFLIASIFPAGTILYGTLVWITTDPLPRFIPDLFIFCGVFLLGLSVLRHQSLVERRTTLQDFPISALTALGLAALYAILALRWGIPAESLAVVVAFVILTHSLYDLVREFLERQRIRHESTFRRQLKQLENQPLTEEALQIRLQEGLKLLCDTMNSSGGFIAIRSGENFAVSATRESIAIDTHLPSEVILCEDISQPKSSQLSKIAWIAPAFEGQTQVAVIGIGKPKAKLDYSTGDLDLLAEVAGQVATIVSLSKLNPLRVEQMRRLATEEQRRDSQLGSVANEMMTTISANTDEEFIKIVEEALRHLPDTIMLGQSALAEKISFKGESHIERGKHLQELLIASIESLKPGEKRPPEPLPRVWYNHAVLYDAYMEGVPNREIMARLYISEGTFNRTRRNAIRGLARMLVEKSRN